jgi:RNA polymerase sigma-70 factor (ECF subfamily)
MALERERLHACHARGRQAWPQVDLAMDRFEAYVDQHDLAGSDLEERAADLYLVAAALEGNAGALKELDTAYMRRACTTISRLDSSETFRDEVEQRLRVRLLTGPAPGLHRYRAASGLLDWMRVVAWRVALDTRQADGRLLPTEDVPVGRQLLGEAEREAMKGLDLEDFRRALAVSFERLPARERTLLRLHFMNGLNIDAIGTAYGVHRATVARWLVTIRRTLFESVRDLLATERPLDSRSMRSLYRLLEPDLHVTLSGLLAGAPSGGAAAPRTGG